MTESPTISAPSFASSRVCSYVLITPARNEAEFIEGTIRCMVRQTVCPIKWVIVSDGSTDGTDEIVRRHASDHPWIELVRTPERKERHFAGKVHAFNAGYLKVKDLKYDVIGSLDADITFHEEYFSFLLGRFREIPTLGVAGTPFSEEGVTYDYRFTSLEHVSGACQLFRRECFEAIGGYVPIKAGGIDLVAVVTARMKGWKTRTFIDNVCLHHRKMGTGQHRRLPVAYKAGYHDYLMGVHPIWQFLRSAYQMTRPPCVIGGVLLCVGYFWAMLTRAQKPVTPEFVTFRRQEQMARLRQEFRRWFDKGNLS